MSDCIQRDSFGGDFESKSFKWILSFRFWNNLIISLFIVITNMVPAIKTDWNLWWTYDGISGPEFWGILNPDWFLCSKGHRQSPIDIRPNLLLFDPNLKSLAISKNRITGIIENDGHSVVFHQNDPQSDHLAANHSEYNQIEQQQSQSISTITIKGGPLSYSYVFHKLRIHFGLTDSSGSEHQLSGFQFPGEIQLIGYNAELFESYDDASRKPNGLVGIAIFLKIDTKSSSAIEIFTSQLNKIRYRGQKASLKSFSLRDLFPDDQNYLTYEGSLTTPSCDESITWIIINKPLSITKNQIQSFRNLMQGSIESPKAPLGNNFRSIQSINDRVIRTNIDFKSNKEKICSTMKQKIYYTVNQNLVK
ncbi:Carbonic anhydrase-related protein 10 [Sarcoptes scabiei]|uniref:Carbonic anhydrase-related protein 10 n=1 Tax=Sarcoptes scabiei TaxID=52283 RepID=A0A834V9B9_SARSC|nr:Carbonic anhydrase-related protein 10 [Sarcoptes scabiei]